MKFCQKSIVDHQALVNTEYAALGPLAHFGVLRIGGPDALTFLQGQLSNDLRRLATDAPLVAACANPQGRVIARLDLLPYAGDVLALLPRDLAAATLAKLKKYVLRSKVRLEDASGELAVFGALGEPGLIGAGFSAPAAPLRHLVIDGCVIARTAGEPARFWVVGPAATLGGRTGRGECAAGRERAWRLADIRAGSPQVYAATSEAFVAQMLNLDLLDGISFTKGCYTGQEIIARTQHLGRIKRRTLRLRLPPGDYSIGQSIRLDDGRSGRLLEVQAVDGHAEALAVLPLESEAEADAPAASVVAGAHALPLPYPLAPAA